LKYFRVRESVKHPVDRFTPAVLVAFLNSCHDHASYLMTKYYASINWSLTEAEGLAFIAFTFPEFKEAKKWKEEAIARLNDEAFGDGIGDVDLHFQLASGNAVFDTDQYAVRSDFSDGWNILVRSASQGEIMLEEEEGWVSFVYAKKERRPAFRFRVRKEMKDEGVRFVTVVAPFLGSIPEVGAKIVGQPKPGASEVPSSTSTMKTAQAYSFP